MSCLVAGGFLSKRPCEWAVQNEKPTCTNKNNSVHKSVFQHSPKQNILASFRRPSRAKAKAYLSTNPGLPRVVSTALAYSRKIIPFEPKQLQKWNSIKVFLTLTNSTGVTGRRVGSPAPRAVSHLQATHLTELILHLYKPVSFRVIIHSGHLVFSFSEHNRFHMAWHVSSLPEHEHVHENVMGCCFPGIQGHEHVMACFASCMDMSWHVLLTCPWHVMRTCCMSSWFRFTHACVLRPRP